MSDTITVHDHSEPCEHGSLWPHWLNAAKARWWHEPDCLGGKAMTLQHCGDGLWSEVEEQADSSASESS